MAQPWAPAEGTPAGMQLNFCHCVICGKGMHYPVYSTPKGITYCEEHRPDKEPEVVEPRVRMRAVFKP